MAKIMWIHGPKRNPPPKIPASTKVHVKSKADQLIETVLKPRHIEPPPENINFNYIVDIYSKWHGCYFYLCSKYSCPGPGALSPSFEDRFARLEYIGPDRFNLAFKRHTSQWVEIFSDLSLDECLKEIEAGNFFVP